MNPRFGSVFLLIHVLLSYSMAVDAPMFSQEETVRAASKRKALEMRDAEKWTVFHDFTFTNTFPSSGITFEHRAVDDASKYWIPAHYDHGSAVAAADINGDGK